MTDTWRPSLMTPPPQERFEVTITMSRRGVKYTRPDAETLKRLRPRYAGLAHGPLVESQASALKFQAIASAHNCWQS